eukprot:364577-Chlamydomonas_euryale.AAC.1
MQHCAPFSRLPPTHVQAPTTNTSKITAAVRPPPDAGRHGKLALTSALRSRHEGLKRLLRPVASCLLIILRHCLAPDSAREELHQLVCVAVAHPQQRVQQQKHATCVQLKQPAAPNGLVAA